MKSWRDENDLMQANVTKYITNPLNAFLLIKRTKADVALIRKFFFKQSDQLLRSIKHLQPTDADLTGAVEGLLRLQTVYWLHSEDFAEGIVDGVETRPGLSAHDLFVIGEEAYKLEKHDFFATTYFNLAWTLVKNGHDADGEVDEEQLLYYLSACYNKAADFVNELAVIEALIELSPDERRFHDYKANLEDDLAEKGNNPYAMENPYAEDFEVNGEFTFEKEKILYRRVCRGSVERSAGETSKLRCRFVSNSFFSKIAPFKVEEANLDPYIVLYVDILSNGEVEFLKNISRPHFERAFVGWDSNSKIENKRIAQLAWHYDDDHEVLKRIAKRVEVS